MLRNTFFVKGNTRINFDMLQGKGPHSESQAYTSAPHCRETQAPPMSVYLGRTLVCVTKLKYREGRQTVCEYEVSVTSERHALAERTNNQKRLHPFEAKAKTLTQSMVLQHGSVADESGCGRRPECTG